MSVVEKANHIIVLDDGMVKEEGSHDALMRKCGLYAELVEKQNKGFHRQGEERNDAQWYIIWWTTLVILVTFVLSSWFGDYTLSLVSLDWLFSFTLF